MTMQVKMLGGDDFPCRWTADELPHDLRCGVSMEVEMASMSEISGDVWVPNGWREKLFRSWCELEQAARAALDKRLSMSQHAGSRVVPPRDHKKIDHWAIIDALPNDRLVGAIGRHGDTVSRLIDQISNVRKKPNVVKITPEEWLKIRDQLRVFDVPIHHWSAELEREKYDELLAFLTDGSLPDRVVMDAKHLPSLTQEQAAGVLWFLSMVTGVDVNDIRYDPCGMCGCFHTSDETSYCAGCSVSMCENCFWSHSGRVSGHDLPEWPEGLEDEEAYCDKCVELVEQHLAENVKGEESPSSGAVVGNRPDVILVDDPQAADGAGGVSSEQSREWYEKTVRSRKKSEESEA